MESDSRLNMSLDDIIKLNKSSISRGGSRGGGGGGGDRRRRGGGGGSGGVAPSRLFANRVANRSTPYSRNTVKAPESIWKHDMFETQGGGGGGGGGSIESGTKLYVSNLDYGVSNDDIKELFCEVGDLKRYSVHYDRSGRSKGTAEVVFTRREDALAAVKRYNNVELDGKPMKIEIVGANLAMAGKLPPAFNGVGRNPVGSRSGQGRVGALGRIRGGRGFGRGCGRGRGRNDKVVSVDDLDADLDKYHSEAMQTN